MAVLAKVGEVLVGTGGVVVVVIVVVLVVEGGVSFSSALCALANEASALFQP